MAGNSNTISIIPRAKFNIVDDMQLYLQPDFHAVRLQKMLGTDFGTLTTSINFHFNCTFLEYITGKRIRYIRKKIHDGTLSSSEEVMALTGGQKTFPADFAKVYGKTPEELFGAYAKLKEIKGLMKTYNYDVTVG